MKMYEKAQPLEKYLNNRFECRCGRTHYSEIKGLAIGEGKLRAVPVYMHEFGYESAFIVCDRITWKVAAEKCEELIKEEGLKVTSHVISHEKYDEATLGELIISLPKETDVVIAVGTGAITDMIRYMTYKVGLPCFTVATAAPMDGFAASIGVMNVNNLKCTMPAHNTEIIVGDTSILAEAPSRMTISGFGDLIGKIVCLNDWKLSSVINGEHICPDIIAVVENAVETVIRNSSKLKNRDHETVGMLMKGLVASGIAMSLYGDSRPASGSEHHMSHFWETIGEQRETCYAMHGEQVAVGTVVSLMVAEELLTIKPDFSEARRKASEFSYEAWEKKIRGIYGPSAEEIIAIEAKAGKNIPQNVLQRLNSMEMHQSEVNKLLRTLPSSDYVISILKNAGCPALPEDIGIDADTLRQTIIYCKETRPRYTILQYISY